MKMLNVDPAKWYQSRICLYQTCYFLCGVYLLCLTSFTRELPRICKSPRFGREGCYDLHIPLCLSLVASPTVVIGTLPSHPKVNVSAQIPSNPWVVPWLQFITSAADVEFSRWSWCVATGSVGRFPSWQQSTIDKRLSMSEIKVRKV